MKKISAVSIGLMGFLSVAGCNDLTVPNLNEPTVDALEENPSRVAISAAAQGLLRTTRANAAAMVQWLGAFGREGYPMTQTGASLSGSVQNRLSGGNFPGNTLWNDAYRNIRNANLLFEAVEATEELAPEEKEAVLGFAKTVQAYDFLNVILTRWDFGAPIDVGGDPIGEPAPFVSREEVFAHVVRLLDEAVVHLEAGGEAFPFRVHSGLSDFDTPQSFIMLNRALRARAAVYMDDWQGALDALEASFLDLGAPLESGAYHVFSTTSGDVVNPLNRPDFLYAHPRFRDEAQLQDDGSPDLRAQQKLMSVPSVTIGGITSDVQYTLYDDPTAPLPWIRNEELILLRAEANLGLGNVEEALEDINFIRVNSGGLAPISTQDPDELLDELLYNKRYSLIWEGGHVWIDLRHYDRLEEIPVTPADPIINRAMPVPANECFSRNPEPEGCGEIPPVVG